MTREWWFALAGLACGVLATGAGVLVASVVSDGSGAVGASVAGAGDLTAAASAEPTTTALPTTGATTAPAEGVAVPRTDDLEPAPEGMASAAASTDSVSCPGTTVSVDDADGLHAALAAASPGDVIGLADGEYAGEFVATADGTEAAPIWLCGGRDAQLVGEGHDDGYGLHLDGAAHWRLVGFTVRDSQKGVMADGTTGTVIQGLEVRSIGDEAIHLRGHSTANAVRGNVIHDTGNRREKFGEGVYIGTAESNWCDITDCEPDRSDGNVVEGNTIYDVTAEAVDLKEGTTGGSVIGNSFDGSSMTEDGADSWVDVKGNDWTIVGNVGAHSLMDGFQTHEILDGWGTGNHFADNTATVDGPGFGFSLTPELANTVSCSNIVESADEGYATTTCT